MFIGFWECFVKQLFKLQSTRSVDLHITHRVTSSHPVSIKKEGAGLAPSFFSKCIKRLRESLYRSEFC